MGDGAAVFDLGFVLVSINYFTQVTKVAHHWSHKLGTYDIYNISELVHKYFPCDLIQF